MGSPLAPPASTPLDVDTLASLNAKANVALDMFLDADPTQARNTTRAAYVLKRQK